MAGKETILQSSGCLQWRKCQDFTKLSCKLQSHFSDKKNGNVSKTAQSRPLALYTWATQTLFLSPGGSIKHWDEREASILLGETVRPWAMLEKTIPAPVGQAEAKGKKTRFSSYCSNKEEAGKSWCSCLLSGPQKVLLQGWTSPSSEC